MRPCPFFFYRASGNRQMLLVVLLSTGLLSFLGCAVMNPNIVVPKAPSIPANTDFYHIQGYQSDLAAYSAAAEGFACSSTGAGVTAARLAFCTQSNGAANGTLGSLVVQVQDSAGALVINANNPITIASTPAGVAGTLMLNAVSGVATFSNLSFPAAGTFVLTASSPGLNSGSSVTTIVAAGNTPPPSAIPGVDLERARYFRNKIAYNFMGEIDYVYNQYAGQLFISKAGQSIVGDTANLGLTSASTITRASGTKTLLSALASGLTGINLSVDKNLYSQQTFQALAIAMQARRDQARATIVANLQLSVTDYPLAATRRDLVSYFYAGTLPGALQEIQEEAAKTSNETTAAGPAAKLTFTQTANGSATHPVTLVVQVQDAAGKLVTSATNQVTIAPTPADGITGGLTANAVSGVATFNLIFANVNTYTLNASATGLTSANTTVQIVAADATPPPVAAPQQKQLPAMNHVH